MPKPSGDFWADVDVDLYDIAESALGRSLPIKQWSFMVINQTNENSKNGDNSQNSDMMIKELGKQHLHVVGALQADCSIHAQTSEGVLDPMLEYLTNNIERLDQKYVQFRQQEIFDAHLRIENFIANAVDYSLSILDSTSANGLFVALFRDAWEKVTTRLQGLTDELRQKCDQPDEEYQEMVKEVISLAASNKHIPSLSEVAVRRAGHDGFKPAYDHLLTQMRVRISKHFKRIYTSIGRIVEKRKQQIFEAFSIQGRLQTVFPSPVSEPNSFFRAVADRIEIEEPQFKFGLAEAFRLLSHFEYSRSAVLYRLRNALSRFDPDSSCKAELEELTEEQIIQKLDLAYNQTVEELQKILERFACEPNQAAFAMTSEFVDRTIRAKGAEDDWRVVYQNLREEVWAEKFSEINRSAACRNEWQAMIAKLSEFGLRRNFDFTGIVMSSRPGCASEVLE